MDKWAKANNVKLTRIPMAYSVFMEKVTATLTSGADQFDMIWHNDDWGQLWKKWLETTDDVKGHRQRRPWRCSPSGTTTRSSHRAHGATPSARSSTQGPSEGGGGAKTFAELRHGQPAPAEGSKVKWATSAACR